jgi:hypothetical protein
MEEGESERENAAPAGPSGISAAQVADRPACDNVAAGIGLGDGLPDTVRQLDRQLPLGPPSVRAPQLRPYQWPKGTSGNPRGPRKQVSTIPVMLRTIGATAMPPSQLVEKLRLYFGTLPPNMTWREGMLRACYVKALAGEQWAVNFIADRTEGKVADRLRLDGELPDQRRVALLQIVNLRLEAPCIDVESTDLGVVEQYRDAIDRLLDAGDAGDPGEDSLGGTLEAGETPAAPG